MSSSQNLVDLNSRFSIPGVVRFDTGKGGLTRIVVSSPLADGEIYLHGAHVTQFTPKNHAPMLFVSSQSVFEAGKPIRGGVPICFPWFAVREGDPSAPLHGTVRLMEWAVESTRTLANGAVEIVLALDSSAQTMQSWAHEFAARFRVSMGPTLAMTLEVRNTSATPFVFEEALHTYFAVSDVRNISITGLETTEFLDKTDGFKKKTQGVEPIRITGETDRIYLNTRATCVINDPGGASQPGRRVLIKKTNSDNTVVWNPWIAKAKAMPDFGDDEWSAMLCIETCNVKAHAVQLAPGATHQMTATIAWTEQP